MHTAVSHRWKMNLLLDDGHTIDDENPNIYLKHTDRHIVAGTDLNRARSDKF
jgi:hypothetical protein